MNIIELAIENGFSPPECPDEWADKIYQSTLKRLEAFAQAVIEEYKASLVPVGFCYKLSNGNYAFYKDQYDTGEPLYALGETK